MFLWVFRLFFFSFNILAFDHFLSAVYPKLIDANQWSYGAYHVPYTVNQYTLYILCHNHSKQVTRAKNKCAVFQRCCCWSAGPEAQLMYRVSVDSGSRKKSMFYDSQLHLTRLLLYNLLGPVLRGPRVYRGLFMLHYILLILQTGIIRVLIVSSFTVFRLAYVEGGGFILCVHKNVHVHACLVLGVPRSLTGEDVLT